MKTFQPIMNDQDKPLVSVLVYNYNYGRYLRECLDSVIEQTYTNIEIIFSDNASTDDSWKIAQEFSERYPGYITLIRNRTNIGPGANLKNCLFAMRGTYFITLCSDDVMMPEYVEKCLNVFKCEPNLGYVMVHSDEVDAEGNRANQLPFYNRSCIIPGEEQAAVYMMAAVNPSVSQIMYHRQKVKEIEFEQQGASVASRWFGARILDFNLCTKYPMGYLSDTLMLHRIHGLNDSAATAGNLLEVMGPYILQLQFSETANRLGLKKISNRLELSLEKLAQLALRYSVRSLLKGDELTAKKYFHMAVAVDLNIEQDATYLSLKPFWGATESIKKDILNSLTQTVGVVSRTVSYDPPSTSLEIK